MCLYERLSVVKITLIQIVIKLIDGMSSKLSRGPGGVGGDYVNSTNDLVNRDLLKHSTFSCISL